MKTKPNCYDCKWRGDLPGNCHSCCNHPKNDAVMGDPLAQIFGILAGVGRVAPFSIDSGLGVTGDPYGIRSGWFNYPTNFDPVWLLTCDGFEGKEVSKNMNAETKSELSFAVSPTNATNATNS